jgi:hypothetical protein
MIIVSFGWTAPAFRAREKTVTRRDWKPSHVKKFKKGRLFAAYDKDPRYGGKSMGVARVLEDAYLEPMSHMPDADYEKEGFAYLAKHPELVPKSMPIDVSREGFEAWRMSGGSKTVLRFEIVSMEPR